MFHGGPVAPKWIRILYHLPKIIRLVGRLWADPRVPIYRKAIPVLAAFGSFLVGMAYVLLPDFLPDAIPFVGRVDDLAILVFLTFVPGAWLFIRLSPPDVVAEHIREIEAHRGPPWS